jgi:hypothetical protein
VKVDQTLESLKFAAAEEPVDRTPFVHLQMAFVKVVGKVFADYISGKCIGGSA